jgi:hypothetical protein
VDRIAYRLFGEQMNPVKISNPLAGIFFVLHMIAKLIATEFEKGPAERIT